MNKMSVMLFAIGLVATGCQEKEEEGVDFDRIVQLIEQEESADWKMPEEADLISGHLSPENHEGPEPCKNEAFR